MRMPSLRALPREMLLLLIRHALSAIGVLLVSQGILTESDMPQAVEAASAIVGALLTIAGLAWSAQRKIERAKRAEIAATPQTGGHPAK